MSDVVIARCPNCGSPLQPVTLGGDHAPWLCSRCRLGFWDAELTQDARQHWRPSHRDFGHGPHVKAIREARDAHRARQRGGV